MEGGGTADPRSRPRTIEGGEPRVRRERSHRGLSYLPVRHRAARLGTRRAPAPSSATPEDTWRAGFVSQPLQRGHRAARLSCRNGRHVLYTRALCGGDPREWRGTRTATKPVE